MQQEISLKMVMKHVLFTCQKTVLQRLDWPNCQKGEQDWLLKLLIMITFVATR